MSATVLCHGCGLQVSVPSGHASARLRCPECGVMCAVPDALREKAAPQPASRAPAAPPVESMVVREEPPAWGTPAPAPTAEQPFRPAPPAPMPAPPLPSPGKRKKVFTCPSCGELVRAPLGKRRQAWRCPVCACPAPEPAAKRVLPPPKPLPPPESEVQHGSQVEDDDRPYPVDRPPDRKCPGCGKVVPVQTVLCVTCGFHFSAGEKVGRTYETLERHWEAGLPLRQRLFIFLALQVVGVAIFWEQALEESWLVFVIPWLFYTLLLAFVLGTFDRLDVTRNERGQVRVRRRWRIGFVPRTAWKVPWRQYEGVVTGRTREGGCLTWLVVVCLVPMGILPAILWWYFFVQRDAHYLALTQDHDCPVLILYRGMSQERVEDMATVLQDATALPWRKA